MKISGSLYHIVFVKMVFNVKSADESVVNASFDTQSADERKTTECKRRISTGKLDKRFSSTDRNGSLDYKTVRKENGVAGHQSDVRPSVKKVSSGPFRVTRSNSDCVKMKEIEKVRPALARRHPSTCSLPSRFVKSVPESDMHRGLSLTRKPRMFKHSNSEPCKISPDSVCASTPSPTDVNDRFLKRCSSDQEVGSNYQQLDIVGESFDARFPWQRDVSVQCNIPPVLSPRSYISPPCYPSSPLYPTSPIRKDEPHNSVSNAVAVVRRRKQNFKKERPKTIGPIENNMFENELAKFRDMHSRRNRLSDPNLANLFQSPPGTRKRGPLILSDDTGSISDLESILENPDMDR
ncbi:hypothetical protein LOTGIDRAFT_165161 [Lottia gigantea]|uniref:Uncharacterized protein n=1 Tax=Lottia gigantea TaxID=225164 RepID=V3ZCF6_LOTGI|nr:hypothetical protein LOTGIDRAFT_165161 [Lottia gigantea]ESO88748.1 hypothetical protein LOTGIDRAFT_165161 [Lottia gigantea]